MLWRDDRHPAELLLIMVTPRMKTFSGSTDLIVAQMQINHVHEDLSILGGALLIAQFGAGPLSP
jgi:uncharacterized membrane protein YphA (DoxX/SURF4 family)